MSPEQAEGKPVDARSDIFSFRAILNEMLSGRRAFQADTTISTLAAVLNVEPAPLATFANGIPEAMQKIVSRCLRKDPEQRFQTVADLRMALREVQDELHSPPKWQRNQILSDGASVRSGC
jgi:eukaryotic-like serine/threonine-protein kinase